MSEIYPQKVADWSYNVIQKLIDLNYEEDQYIEYKETLRPPRNISNRREWKADLEHEFCALANANGGFIIFGIKEEDDKKKAIGLPKEKDLDLVITELVKHTTPLVSFEPKSIGIPNSDKVILAVKVNESNNKPVSSSRSAYYIRIGSSKQPIPRNLLMDLFVSHELKQQRCRRLLYEINTIIQVINEWDSRNIQRKAILPEYCKLDVESLKEAIRENYDLYGDDINYIIDNIIRQTNDIKGLEKTFEYNLKMFEFKLERRDPNRLCEDNNEALFHEAQRLKKLLEQLKERIRLP